MSEHHPLSFPPGVLARISPELSLHRHLSIGLRPNLRTFTEFRNVTVSTGGLSRYSEDTVRDSSILGSSVVRSGGCTVVCTVSGGLVEEDLPAEVINEDAAAVNAVFAKEKAEEEKEKDTLEEFACVYPVVEVERGRVGAPTDEEMILSQKLYETVLHSKLLSKDALRAKVGLRGVDGEVLYPQEDDEFQLGPKRNWSFVLYAKIKVFSRSGPLFDLVWCALMTALKNTQLPRCYIDESAADIKVPVKIRGNFGTVREQYQITCDAVERDPLQLNEEEIGFSSNYGVVEIDPEAQDTVADEDKMELDSQSVLLADLEGEEEEVAAKKTVSVVLDKSGDEIKSLCIVGGVSKKELKSALELAKLRSKHLVESC